jgi:hypothetical protein
MAKAELARWQTRMAPIMAGLVVLAALFFAAITLLEFQSFQQALSAPRPAPPAAGWPVPEAAAFDQQLQVSVARTSWELEREVVARRYDQTAMAIGARLWTRFMGFTTGMLLALIGAAFVLGRLQDGGTTLAGGGESAGQKLSLSLQSASPGLVLAVLGSGLMAMSIVAPTTADVEDRPTYVAALPAVVGSAPVAARTTDDLLKAAPP